MNPDKIVSICDPQFMLKSIFISEFIRPICLPTEGEKGKPGDKVSVAGWGSIVPGKQKVDHRSRGLK